MVSLRLLGVVVAVLAVTFTIASLTPWNHGDQSVALYLGSGFYGDDRDVSNRGVAFDSRSETPAYDGTHNVANFGIVAGGVDPACAVLPRKKCLPPNLAEWRHGTPLPKKYAAFVHAINKQWGGAEAIKPTANPGSKEARFFFQQAKQSDSEPPWDHPHEAERAFAKTDVPILKDEVATPASDSSASDGNNARFADNQSEDASHGDGDASIRQMRDQIAKLKEEVRRAKERRELEHSADKLQAELRRLNSGEAGEDEGELEGARDRWRV